VLSRATFGTTRKALQRSKSAAIAGLTDTNSERLSRELLTRTSHSQKP